MPERAHVTSVEALESFRASLILYVSKARPTLEEISSDILRTKLWLQNDQRIHWESQVRRRSKELEQAQQALSSARMSNLRQTSTAEQVAVARAKHAREEAEGKLKLLKQWNRQFDSQVEPLVKQLEKLHTVLGNDMLQATGYLTQAINALAAYAELAPPSTVGTSAPPGEQDATPGVATSENEAGVLPEEKSSESLTP